MPPGGKIARHEDALSALAREVLAELGCRIRSGSARFLGQCAAPAANAAGECALADLYPVELGGDVVSRLGQQRENAGRSA
jgi:8-oxo-dGTP pyrophosphatase MutT (NUDIX family)